MPLSRRRGLAPVRAPLSAPQDYLPSIRLTTPYFQSWSAVGIVALATRSAMQTHGPLRLALATALLVWIITSLVATVEENRTTWLLLALVALAGRLAVEEPQRLAACFAAQAEHPKFGISPEPVV